MLLGTTDDGKISEPKYVYFQNTAEKEGITRTYVRSNCSRENRNSFQPGKKYITIKFTDYGRSVPS